MKTTALSPGQYYSFTVSAENSIGEGPQSLPSLAYIAAQVPSEPLLLEATSADSTQVSIKWTAPLNNNGSPVSKYTVYMNDIAVTPAQGTTVLTGTHRNSIVAGELYTFKITATNGRGESLPSSSISVYAATVPSAPQTLLRSSTTTQFSITFTWSAPLTSGGSPVTDYSVFWD